MSLYQKLIEKIKNNNELTGVIGLGYVGLPLAVTFALKGMTVLGFENNLQKAEKVNSGENYIGDISDDDLKKVIVEKKLSATTDMARLKECDAIIICVPTPLDKFKKPDMSFIENACVSIGKNIKKGVFISLESTTYPTTTEEFILPIIEKTSGLKCGADFWLCFSPERVDPGNINYKTSNTPKVVGGLGEEGQNIALELYGKAIEHIYPVSSPRIAEMVKILENTYRLINISLINEMALLCGKMEINIWEVIDAAKSKPYGFQAFYPGPGIGGHCIPLDPFYLEHIAKNYGFDLTMIHAAGCIDNLMPHRMVIKITSALNKHKRCINGSKIMFLGVAYKQDINDERESPALKIMDEVLKKGGGVSYFDPFIPEVKTPNGNIFTRVSYDMIKSADCVVIATAHSTFKEEEIIREAKIVVDLRNVIKTVNEKVYKL